MKKYYFLIFIFLFTFYSQMYGQVNIRKGMAVMTCKAKVSTDPVLKVVDLNLSSNKLFANVNPWVHSNSSLFERINHWTYEDLGQIFGVTTDEAYSGEHPFIYVTNSSSFGGSNSVHVGEVIKLNSLTRQIELRKALPNNGSGLGNISYDGDHKQLFVSNFHDGLIYRLDLALNTLSFYDFGSTYDPTQSTNDFVPKGERVWAVCYRNNKLYFSIWKCDVSDNVVTNSNKNEIYSIDLDPTTGDFELSSGHLNLLKSIDYLSGQNFTSPISDIEISDDGSLLYLAERSMIDDITPCANLSRVIALNTSSYSYSTNNYFNCTNANAFTSPCVTMAGINGYSSCGGIATSSPTTTGSYTVYSTADLSLLNGGNTYNFSGVSLIPSAGNTSISNASNENFYYDVYDLNYSISNPNSGEMGDIDIYKTSQNLCAQIESITKKYAVSVGTSPPQGCYNELTITVNLKDPTVNVNSFSWEFENIITRTTTGASANIITQTLTSPTSSPIKLNVKANSCCISEKSANIFLCPADPEPCKNCITSFSPFPCKKYLISGWVKEVMPNNSTVTNYSHPSIKVEFINNSKSILSSVSVQSTGGIIDGWQKIEGEFVVPCSGAEDVNIKLENTGTNTCLFDDIRVYPFDGMLKSYSYDAYTLRLSAELDERNYATFYEYDEEGKLIRVKKETERGVMTIQESKNNTSKK